MYILYKSIVYLLFYICLFFFYKKLRILVFRRPLLSNWKIFASFGSLWRRSCRASARLRERGLIASLKLFLFLSLRQNFVLPPPSSEGGLLGSKLPYSSSEEGLTCSKPSCFLPKGDLIMFQSVIKVPINESLLSVRFFTFRTYFAYLVSSAKQPIDFRLLGSLC